MLAEVYRMEGWSPTPFPSRVGIHDMHNTYMAPVEGPREVTVIEQRDKSRI